MRKALPLLLFAMCVWVVSCRSDSLQGPIAQGDRSARAEVPCDEYPNDPECTDDDPDNPPPGELPPCAAIIGGTVGSATPSSDTTLYVQLNGPNHVVSCSGPAIWRAYVSGTSQSLFYYWYVAQCRGGVNYCDTDTSYVLVDSGGAGHDTLATTLASNVRAQFTFVMVREATSPNYLTGASLHKFTRGPAWGPEPSGGVSGSLPCVGDGYPLTQVDSNRVRHYTRNVCNGHKVFEPQP